MGLKRGQLLKDRRTGAVAEVIREWFNEWAGQWRVNVRPLGAAPSEWQIWDAGNFAVVEI